MPESARAVNQKNQSQNREKTADMKDFLLAFLLRIVYYNSMDELTNYYLTEKARITKAWNAGRINWLQAFELLQTLQSEVDAEADRIAMGRKFDAYAKLMAA